MLFIPFVVIAGAGLVLNVSAFAFAPASLLAPLLYAQIVGAIAFGWFVFGSFPDAWTWGGIVLVVAAGLYITWRERRGSAAAPRVV